MQPNRCYSRFPLPSISLALLLLGLLLSSTIVKAAVSNQVSARFNHSVAVKSDGTVWTWGNNSNGQIGDGSTTQRNSPVQVPGISAAVSVTAGYFHTLSLSSDGSVRAWGSNANGQIGDGTTTQRNSPVTVAGISDVVEIKAGYAHSVALKADGTVWAWGLNHKGQIGDGSTTQRNSPVQIPGISGVISIAAGFYHTLALKSDGTVWAWGENTSGQIGDGTTLQRNSPVRVGTLDAVVSLSAGLSHSLALKTDGTVRAWGSNTYGQLGDGTTTQRNSPVTVNSMGNVVTVAAAFGSSMFLKADGRVWGCGMNSNSQLGDGTTIQRTTPVQVAGGLVGVASLALGNSHSLAVKADGTVWAWGFNVNGQLGRGNTNGSGTPVQTLVLTGISASQASRTQGAARNGHGVSLSAGALHSMSLNSKGEVWAWGSNNRGQLGNGTTDFKPLPIKLPGINGVTVLAAGREHSLALKSDGRVWAWGANDQGQLGDGTTTDRPAPTLVPGLSGIVAIAAGSFHSHALKSDGTLMVWGGNSRGQLGTGNTTTRLSPVALSSLTGIISLGAGATHSLALRHDGTVWTWGGNDEGRLGDGSTLQRNAPVQVTGLSAVAAIAGGDFHSVALKTDGTVWTWGANSRGQLGNGTTVSSLSPVQIPLLNGIVAIAAGRNHSVALSWNGTVRSWGANECAQAGIGSMFDQKTPVQIPDLPNIIALTAACDHNLTLAMDGGIIGWGRNSSSQLGDKSVIERAAPIKVVNASEVVSLSAGINHTLARKSNGDLLTWGYNDFGQLGSGTDGLRSIPAPITNLGEVRSQAGGATHTLLAKTDGTVWACGGNANGQLGDGTILPKNSLTQVLNLSNIARVAAGTAHSLTLAADGTVWTWGANAAGQLGHVTTTQQNSPVQIPNLTDVTEIACGASHSLILKSNGTVWACGQNSAGQLGDGTTTQRNSPIQVTGLTNIIAIAAGGSHSLALKDDKTLWIWGSNSAGQLGNGTTTANPTPTQVQGLSDVVSIAAGSNHTAALLLDGTLMSWGANASGQLGDGTKLQQLSPVLIAGKYGPNSSLSAGGDKTYVIKEDGTLFAWGLGAYGELANAFAEFRHKGVSALGFNRVHPVPSLAISSPPSPTELATGANVAIELDATVTNGQISKAFFYADGILLKQDDTTPFTFDYSPDTWGNVDINAVVVSSTGAISAPAGLFLKTPYDFDQDGYPDWQEIRDGMNPTVPDPPTTIALLAPHYIPLPPGGVDSDQDGISDAWEQANGLDLADDSDANLDFDRDGHTNLTEYNQNTDPRGAPYYRLREVGPLDSLTSALLSDSILGDGAITNEGTLESVYFMGTPTAGGQRPLTWTVKHGDTTGNTIAYQNFSQSANTTIRAQASGGASLTAPSSYYGPVNEFYFWRNPTAAPVTLFASSPGNGNWNLSGARLTAAGNYLVGPTAQIMSPTGWQLLPIIWKMPVGNVTFSPLVLTAPQVTLSSRVYANDHGFVAGTGYLAGRPLPILWKVNESATGVAVASNLSHPPGAVTSSVVAISDEALPLLVGRSESVTFQIQAAAWRSTQSQGVPITNIQIGAAPVDLQIPELVGFSAAAAVSPSGLIVAGICRLKAENTALYRDRVFTSTWKPSTSSWRFQLHGEPVRAAEVLSVNNSGEIFGKSTLEFGQTWTPTLWRHGRAHLLNNIIPAHTNHILASISTLNAQGTLLAKTLSTGAEMTVILTPDIDTDGDGLPDAWENEHYLEPHVVNDSNTDTDGDLLTDLEEFRNGTNPQNPDSDSDGMKDGWELSWGFLPLDSSDAQLDPDNDQVTNARESQIGTTPTGNHRVETRYTTSSTDPISVEAVGETGTIILSEPWQYMDYIDPDGLYISESYKPYWALLDNNSSPFSLPSERYVWGYGANPMNDYLVIDQKVSYAPSIADNNIPGMNGWLTLYQEEENYQITDEAFLMPNIVTPIPDESTWTSWNTVQAALTQGPNPVLQPGYSLSPTPQAVSPSGRCRIHSEMGNSPEQLVLDQNGTYQRTLPATHQWTHINDNGDAIAQEFQLIPAANGQPAYQQQEILLSVAGSTPVPHPLPSSPAIPAYFSIISFSNDLKLLLTRSETNQQLTQLTRHYLYDLGTRTLTSIRQPGLGWESIQSLSNQNGCLVGSGPKPFQITPDGTCIRLEALRIKNTSTDTSTPLGNFYPNTLTPNHIASNGRITLTTTDASNQTVILQLTPHNDTNNNGMPDDWETSVARDLLALNVIAPGELNQNGQAFLESGIDYDGDGIPAGVEAAAGTSDANSNDYTDSEVAYPFVWLRGIQEQGGKFAFYSEFTPTVPVTPPTPIVKYYMTKTLSMSLTQLTPYHNPLTTSSNATTLDRKTFAATFNNSYHSNYQYWVDWWSGSWMNVSSLSSHDTTKESDIRVTASVWTRPPELLGGYHDGATGTEDTRIEEKLSNEYTTEMLMQDTDEKFEKKRKELVNAAFVSRATFAHDGYSTYTTVSEDSYARTKVDYALEPSFNPEKAVRVAWFEVEGPELDRGILRYLPVDPSMLTVSVHQDYYSKASAWKFARPIFQVTSPRTSIHTIAPELNRNIKILPLHCRLDLGHSAGSLIASTTGSSGQTIPINWNEFGSGSLWWGVTHSSGGPGNLLTQEFDVPIKLEAVKGGEKIRIAYRTTNGGNESFSQVFLPISDLRNYRAGSFVLQSIAPGEVVLKASLVSKNGLRVTATSQDSSVIPIPIISIDNVGLIGDMVPSNLSTNPELHFVTPKITTEISEPNVVLNAVGIDQRLFDQFYEWEPNAPGLPPTGSPMFQVSRYPVSRASPGHVPVKIIEKATRKEVAKMNVWVVAAVIDTVMSRKGKARFSSGFGIQIDKTIGGASTDSASFRGLRSPNDEWRFVFDIQPPSIITGFNSGRDVPDLSGTLPPGTYVPGGQDVHQVLGIGSQQSGLGGRFEYGASHFWDVSRQMQITISNPNLIPRDDFAEGWGILYDTQPQITSVPVPYPLDPVMGNDDAHQPNSIAGDESNDPYTSSSNGGLSHNITQIASVDAPSSFVTVAAGAPNRDYGELNEFREFVRVNLGGQWYRVSDYEDWRFDFKVKFIGGKWQNNGCDPIPTP